MRTSTVYSYTTTILFVVIISSASFAQIMTGDKTNEIHGIKLYVDLGVDSITRKSLKEYGFNNVIDINIITTSNKLTFDPDRLTKDISLKIPDKNDNAIVVLDWEGEALNALLTKKIDNVDYRKVSEQFVSAYNLVKMIRPNVSCGFYGLPFRTYWKRDSSWIKKCEQLKPLLSHFDAMFPSVYIPYKDNIDIKEQDNQNYIKDNVRMALRIGAELNKPVYVYIWHRYHDSNKKYGMDLIPLEYFSKQIEAISNSKYINSKPAGIIWWSAESYFSNVLAKRKTIEEMNVYQFSDKEMIQKYLNVIIKSL